MGLLMSCLGLSAKAPEAVERIEPEYWFAGMKQTELQLMVYGDGIAKADVALADYDGVALRSVVRLDSPNYLLVYLNVDEDALPGTLQLTFAKGKKKQVVDYELRARRMAGNARQGFDASDVLYMLMPDRFANGKPENDQLKGMADYIVNREEPSLRHGGDIE